MKKVLVLIHAPHWGGVHTIAERIGPLVAAAGWPWVMVVPEGPDNGADRLRQAGLEVEAIPLHRLRGSPDPQVQARFLYNLVPDIRRIIALIDKHDAQLVQISGLLHFHGALAALRRRRPVIWQLHGMQPALARWGLMPLVRLCADVLMTSGTRLAAAHPGARGFRERLVPFMAPVDADAFAPDPSARAAVRAGWAVDDDQIVVGTVGNRGWLKNHEMLVRVAHRLHAAGHKGLQFRILGADVPSKRAYYANDVVGLARSLGLEGEIVHFQDPGRDVRTLLNGLDIFALPSRAEGASLVTMEAMATGLPVIATSVGSLADSVIEGETGYLVGCDDDEAAARSILRLAGDPALRARLGDAGRQRALSHFTIARCAEAHIAACRLAMAHRPGPARRPGMGSAP